MTTVGFLGPGVMGSPMVRALVAAGYRVTVWARRPGAAEIAGAHAVARPSDAAEADLVIGCLLDDTVVREVYAGIGPRAGQVFVEHGTYSPATARELAERFAGRRAAFLDAPVTGGPEGAAAATLTTMVGGDRPAFDRARDALSCYSASITHVGASGAGLELKLVNQLLVSVHLLAAAEAAAVLERIDLDPIVAATVLGGGWADSAMLRRTLAALAEGDTRGRGATIGGLVEVQLLVAQCLASAGVGGRLLPVAREAFAEAMAAGLGDSDPAALVELYRGGGR
ncbi:NAD(P)-dependent oxidoreductase [Agromyces bauzanensis]